MRRTLPLLLCMLLGGCATYAPEPPLPGALCQDSLALLSLHTLDMAKRNRDIISGLSANVEQVKNALIEMSEEQALMWTWTVDCFLEIRDKTQAED